MWPKHEMGKMLHEIISPRAECRIAMKKIKFIKYI